MILPSYRASLLGSMFGKVEGEEGEANMLRDVFAHIPLLGIILVKLCHARHPVEPMLLELGPRLRKGRLIRRIGI